ncbi:MAG: hypothetical protein HYZ71_13945 [Deltaproteobacteria bacterium]|nr:hypothetical protein [Deltaproteobacteria bacterium]
MDDRDVDRERPGILRAIAAGFSATIIATGVLLIGSKIFGHLPLHFFAMIGQSFMVSNLSSSYYALWGAVWHLNMGAIVFPHFYVLAYYPMMAKNLWLKGLEWGAGLWLFSQLIGLPILGLGLFASHTASPLLVSAGLLVVHLIYGELFTLLCGEPIPHENIHGLHHAA